MARRARLERPPRPRHRRWRVVRHDAAATARPPRCADAYDTLMPLAQPRHARWQVIAHLGSALRLDSRPTRCCPRPSSGWSGSRCSSATDELPADLPASLLLAALPRPDRRGPRPSPLPTTRTDETFTVAAYGDRLWPVVRPQLEALAALPDAWTYAAVAGTPTVRALTRTTSVISLLSDKEPTDNGDESTRWEPGAAEGATSTGSARPPTVGGAARRRRLTARGLGLRPSHGLVVRDERLDGSAVIASRRRSTRPRRTTSGRPRLASAQTMPARGCRRP